MATFPSNPTRILRSSASENATIFVFEPPTSASMQSQLAILNISGTIDKDDVSYTAVSSSPPFLADAGRDGVSYTPAIDSEGKIMVYEGRCKGGLEDSSLWRFTLSDPARAADADWHKLNWTADGSAAGISNVAGGANYLASGISFSATADSSPQIYVFGGMCPQGGSSSISDWTTKAGYSNTMLTFQASSPQSENFSLGVSASRGPPIAEAGFTMTPLEPTFSQSASGGRSQHKNQNFVLVGGHTQQAFINMSQVALFSLPEQSWAFLPVGFPLDTPRTDLAPRDDFAVEPRSGHSTVLSSDGKSLVVFGGWVGDVNTPAKPQLAILELGEGYGGPGKWQWKIPSPTGAGLTDGQGLYSHGAIMLPGEVMMVVGGYSISASDGMKVKRSMPSPNTKTFLLNLTSNSWISSYQHPQIPPPHETPSKSMVSHHTATKKAALAAGLTFGLLACIILVVLYLWRAHRTRRRRIAREEDLKGLAQGTRHFSSGRVVSGGTGGDMAAVQWTKETGGSSSDPYPWMAERDRASLREGDAEAERTGLLFEVPSPTRGLRRSLYSRGSYHPAPRYDEGRNGRGPNNIHPIDERDEYEEIVGGESPSGAAEMVQHKDRSVFHNVPVLDPFWDSKERSRTPSPESPTRAREIEVQKWVNDWAAADALMHQQAGRLSPDKTDRTSSTLSERSMRSNISTHSYQHSTGTVSRSISQRSAALFSTNPFSTNKTVSIPVPSTEPIASPPSPRRLNPDHRRSQSLTLYSKEHRMETSDAFVSKPNTRPQLQLEKEALLGQGSRENSPTTARSRARNWMGSVRRVFGGADRSPFTAAENGELSTASSPTKSYYDENGIPRRAASAGAMLWRKRQGAKDWDAERGSSEQKEGDVTTRDDDDDEWDIESAVERRVVQVMFTVPREKLRIVNGGPDGDGDSFVSADVKDTDRNDIKRMQGNGTEKGGG